jgi:hypothetical protein
LVQSAASVGIECRLNCYTAASFGSECRLNWYRDITEILLGWIVLKSMQFYHFGRQLVSALPIPIGGEFFILT